MRPYGGPSPSKTAVFIKKSQGHTDSHREITRRHQEMAAMCKPRQKASAETNQPAPGPQTSSLQNGEKLFKPPACCNGGLSRRRQCPSARLSHNHTWPFAHAGPRPCLGCRFLPSSSHVRTDSTFQTSIDGQCISFPFQSPHVSKLLSAA